MNKKDQEKKKNLSSVLLSSSHPSSLTLTAVCKRAASSWLPRCHVDTLSLIINFITPQPLDARMHREEGGVGYGGGRRRQDKKKSTLQHDEFVSLKDDRVGGGTTVLFNRSRRRVKQMLHLQYPKCSENNQATPVLFSRTGNTNSQLPQTARAGKKYIYIYYYKPKKCEYKNTYFILKLHKTRINPLHYSFL